MIVSFSVFAILGKNGFFESIMIPTLITVLLVRAGTTLTPPPRSDDPLELLAHSSLVDGWFISNVKAAFDTGTKAYVVEEELPDVLKSDFVGIEAVQSIQSMVTPPSEPFLPSWWQDVGWDDISEDDMFELYEISKRLIDEKGEKPGSHQTYFTVSFIGFWQVETSRDFESQIVDVDAVRFVGQGEVVPKS